MDEDMLAEYQKRKIFGMLMFQQIEESQCFAFNLFASDKTHANTNKPCWDGVLNFAGTAAWEPVLAAGERRA